MSELGPDAREILRNGRDGDDPSPADRARIRAALMATIAAGTATTMAKSASAAADMTIPASIGAAKPAIFGSLFAKGLLVFFLGAAGVGAWVALPTSNSNRAPVGTHIAEKSANSLSESQAKPTSPPALESPEEKPLEVPIVISASALPAKTTAVRESVSATPPKSAEENADSLLVETQRLREAHGALREGDPEKALALLSDQAAEGEGQKLREERAAARVLALCKLGRVDAARAEADTFLAQNPRSPLADRVRKACPKNP